MLWWLPENVLLSDVCRPQASGWEHKCLIAQEALAATQAEAARMQKQAAVSAATAHSQGQLLKQLQAAETALADSLGSSQKLLKELSELRAAHIAAQQDLEGMYSLPVHALHALHQSRPCCLMGSISGR